MSEDDADFTRMDDPEFLDERARIRELLECLPLDHDDYGRLAARYRAMQEEFFRRASIAWSQADGEASSDE
jgi:hypothetical protein